MNDKRKAPDESAKESTPKGRKRVPPTIDLTATEVPQPSQTAQSHEAPPDADMQPVTSETDPPPPPEPVQAAEQHAEAKATGQPEPQGSESIAASVPPARSGFALSTSTLAAGFIGAAAMSAVMLALWLTGLLPIRYAGSTATRARVTALEMQMQDLQNKPAAAVNTQAVDALVQRVAKMEDTIRNLPKSSGAAAVDPALLQRIDAADNAMKSLGVALTALNRRSDEVADKAAAAQQRAEAADKAVNDLRANVQDVSKTASAGASSADLTPLQQRIVALEQQASTTKAEISKTTASDQSARLALSAASLRDAVLRGAPYGDELAQARSFGGDDKLLAPLQPFASTGLPSEQALAQALGAILPGMTKAVAPPPSGNFLDRLQANASQLVRVRPLDAPAGDDAAAALARIDAVRAKGDIAAIVAEIGKLPEPARQLAGDWVARAAARQQAVAAARQFAAVTARSLGSR